MKFYHWIPFTAVACLALVAGQWTGRAVMRWATRPLVDKAAQTTAAKSDTLVERDFKTGAGYPTPTNAQPLPPIPGEQPPNRFEESAKPAKTTQQHNILFIGVDRLDVPTPRLLSAWLLIYLSDQSHLMLLPLHPSQPTLAATHAGRSLASSFEVDENGVPKAAFIKFLADQEILWTGYVIMDEKALASLLDYASGNLENSSLDLIKNLPDSQESPFDAVVEQAKLARDLCLSTGRLSTGNFWQVSGFYASIRDHIRSDINPAESLPEWETRLKSGAITCEFPSLATALVLP